MSKQIQTRRKTVRDLALPAGSTVLDLAAGTGDLCIDLREAGLTPISMDLSYGMLAADRSGAPRVQADILRLPVPDASVDGITCGFALRNLADLDVFFRELARVVRPGGRIALLDVSTPPNRLLRLGNDIYFGKVVPRIGALLSDGAAYRYLPKSVAYLPSPLDRPAVQGVAAEVDKTIPQVALNWLLQRPTGSNVVVGARNADQLKQNLGALGWKLDEAQIAKIKFQTERYCRLAAKHLAELRK